MFKKILLGSTLALCCAGAQALTLSYSETIPTTGAPYNYNFSLTKFDTTLGTLTAVTLNLTLTSTAQVDVFNSTGVSQAFTNANSSVPLTVTGVSGPASATVSGNAVASVAAGTANPGFNSFPGLTGSGFTSTSVAPIDFGFFQGIGASLANFAASASSGSFSGTSVPQVFFSGDAVVGGLFQIVYQYDAPTSVVPVPASLPLMVSGLLGLFLIRRRASR
jgi:hypothetical protein